MLFRRPYYLLLFPIILAATFSIAGCNKANSNDEYTDPYPFPVLPEDNNGTRARSITYVYDRTAGDPSFPPKIDSSVILFSYNAAGKIDRIRLPHNGFYVYDFIFERSNNKLTAIRCRHWVVSTNSAPEVYHADLELQYDASGKVSLMKATAQDDPLHEVDSFIIKSTNNRIDTVIDLTFAYFNGSNKNKYAFTYNASGDITQMDHIVTSGIFYSYWHIYKYTLSGVTAPLILGDEAIFWNFFAHHVDVSSNTDFMVPAILFHSAKQPSNLVLQESGLYTGTYNYQTEYYGTGRPKKMTANVITGTGDFYAREAYYYSYAQ